jgi:hypothetical protein
MYSVSCWHCCSVLAIDPAWRCKVNKDHVVLKLVLDEIGLGNLEIDTFTARKCTCLAWLGGER